MWGLHLGLCGALCVYIHRRTLESRRGPTLQRWGPFALVLLGTLFVLLDLTRHVLLDQNIGVAHLPMYSSEGLSTVGRLGVIFTWVGVALLVLGVGWLLGYQAGLKRCLGLSGEEGDHEQASLLA